LAYNGLSLGPITYGPGYNTGFSQAYLTGLTDPLASTYAFTFTFGAGSNVGSTIATLTSATPEPGSVLLFSIGALGILGFGVAKARRDAAARARAR
jgi:hypothetical protein